ncbi:MAG: hypothetical protein VXV96_02660 [Bdellovibrionota bacterium]|nr:hypothetical protein [Bdellovibrionota bacterium]
MVKRRNLDTLIPLLITGCIFLLLYIPTLNRPFHFEEIKVTRYFHTPPPSKVSIFTQDTMEGSRWDNLWREYLRIQPAGLLYFYRGWSLITQENEILMRLPLLILNILCLWQVFSFFKGLTHSSEAALMTLFTSLGTWWYGMGSIIAPTSFTLLFAFLSICLFFNSLKKKRMSKALILVNFCGLSVSYYFILITLLQLGSLIPLKNLKNIKAFFLANLILLFSCSGLLYWVANPRFSNPLAQHWGKVDHKDPLFLYEYLLLGAVREREIEKPRGSSR